MDCYICNPKSNDENHCENCRFEVYPIQEWMSEKTGDNMWTEDNAPFLQIDRNHANMIAGFIAGGQLPFRLVDLGSVINCMQRLVRIETPDFTYLPFSMNKY